jgi:uncharacterized protein YndB with AHSA1/START domain
MNRAWQTKASTTISASTASVWKALTDPDLIPLYFFGTQVRTDWKTGSPIRFSGTWNNTPYEDQGTLLVVAIEQELRYTYWSSFWGPAPGPEDQSIVTYEIRKPAPRQTELVVRQEGFLNQEGMRHAQASWTHLLEQLKHLLENTNTAS